MRVQSNFDLVDDEMKDRYYELKDFLKESLMGSISRYYTPMSKE